MDEATTMSELKDLIEEFVRIRDWAQFHNPKNLSMAISVETAELVDLFKWHPGKETVELMRRGHVRLAACDEIADIIIYCLAFANRNGIDISEVVKRKISKNRKKYPASKYRGKF